MREAGDDLSVVRPVYFQFALPSLELANKFAEEIAEPSLTVDVSEEGHGPVAELPWDVNVTVEMKPELASISEFECSLGQKAAVYYGRADGWFCERITHDGT
jgi:hypothetical protein